MGIKWKTTYNDFGRPGLPTNLWTVEIIDLESGIDSNIDFVIADNGVEISGQSNTSDHLTTLITTKCTVTMIVDRLGVENFITNLIDSKEEKYWLRVRRGSVVAFLGVILTDGITLQDLDYPFQFQFIAVDVISRLKDIELDANFLPATVSPYYRITQYISEIFKLTKIDEFYPLLTLLFETYVEWRSPSQANTTNMTWVMSGYHYGAFNKKRDNTVDLTTAIEILRSILTQFGARVYWNFGYYIFEQLDYRAKNPTMKRYRFDRLFQQISTDTGITYLEKEYDVNQIRRLSGMTTGFIPPLRAVKVIYSHDPSSGAYIDQQPVYVTGTVITGDEISILDDEQRILIKLNLVIDNQGFFENDPGIPPKYIRPEILIKIKVGTGISARWLKISRSGGTFAAPEYTSIEWSSTETEMQFYPMLVSKAGYAMVRDEILSPKLTDEFSILSTHNVEMSVYGATRYLNRDLQFENNVGHFAFSALTDQTHGTHFQLYPQDGNQATLEKRETTYIATGDLDNSKILDVRTRLGEGPENTSVSSIGIFDGTRWVTKKEDWSVDGIGPGEDINYLLAESILAFQRKPTRIINCTFITHNWQPGQVIDMDGVRYMCLNYRYNTNRQQVSGDWIQISHDKTGIVKEKKEVRTVLEPYSPGKVVHDKPADNISRGVALDLTKEYYHKVEGVTTSTITLPVDWPLPDPTVIGEDEVNRRFQTFISGRRAYYLRGYGFDYDHTTGIFSFLNKRGNATQALDNERVEILYKP